MGKIFETEKTTDDKYKKTKMASALQLAIQNNDDDFIYKFIETDDTREIEHLSKIEKCKLAKMVVKFIKEDCKLNVVKTLKVLVNEVGHVEGVVKSLVDVQIDFNKLMFLKGKIDFLKYKRNSKEEEDKKECDKIAKQ